MRKATRNIIIIHICFLLLSAAASLLYIAGIAAERWFRICLALSSATNVGFTIYNSHDIQDMRASGLTNAEITAQRFKSPLYIVLLVSMFIWLSASIWALFST
jgi:hypothetical protein